LGVVKLFIEYRLLSEGLVKLFEGVTLLLSSRLLNGLEMRFMMGELVRCDDGEQVDLSSTAGDDRLSSPMTLPKYLSVVATLSFSFTRSDGCLCLPRLPSIHLARLFLCRNTEILACYPVYSDLNYTFEIKSTLATLVI